MHDVRCTFWGEVAQRPDEFWAAQPVLAAKGFKVSDFGGVSLSSGFNSQLVWDSPHDSDSVALRQWWNGGGSSHATTSLTTGGGGGGGDGRGPAAFADRACINDIKTKQLGHG